MRSAPRALACHVRVFRFRAPASPAQRILGGGFGRGAKPPSEWNVQRVRLACGPRAPPCSWTLLIALARAFRLQAPSEGEVAEGAAAARLREVVEAEAVAAVVAALPSGSCVPPLGSDFPSRTCIAGRPY